MVTAWCWRQSRSQFLKNLNWAKGIDAKGRPILNDLKENADGETYVCPGFQGGTPKFAR